MKLLRRKFLHLAAGAAVLPAMSQIARPQTYPSRPVHLIVGFFAGGLTDILARLLSPSLSERLGQQFIVEDQPGAGTNLAAEAVVRALPDGYTLLMATSTNAINATLYDKLKFNFIGDTAPVASIARTPLLMEVNPSFPAETVPDFITYAKANPGKINMATAGIGSSVHLAGELFMTMTGVQLVPVHYRASYVPDMLAGQVQVVFSPIPKTIEQVRAGKLRALAVTSGTPSQALPDVPTIAEFVPGYEASVWNGLVAPRNTPAEIIDKLSKEIDAALADPKIMARFAEIGSVPKSMTPADFGKFIAEDTEKWGKVIRAANITVD
ncbi:MAG: tripartite tricarboxylate transporter substrate binding protein [Xanthobacteraceae bacterium]